MACTDGTLAWYRVPRSQDVATAKKVSTRYPKQAFSTGGYYTKVGCLAFALDKTFANEAMLGHIVTAHSTAAAGIKNWTHKQNFQVRHMSLLMKVTTWGSDHVPVHILVKQPNEQEIVVQEIGPDDFRYVPSPTKQKETHTRLMCAAATP